MSPISWVIRHVLRLSLSSLGPGDLSIYMILLKLEVDTYTHHTCIKYRNVHRTYFAVLGGPG